MHFTVDNKANLFLSQFLSYIFIFFKQCCIFLLDRKLNYPNSQTFTKSKVFPGKKSKSLGSVFKHYNFVWFRRDRRDIMKLQKNYIKGGWASGLSVPCPVHWLMLPYLTTALLLTPERVVSKEGCKKHVLSAAFDMWTENCNFLGCTWILNCMVELRWKHMKQILFPSVF